MRIVLVRGNYFRGHYVHAMVYRRGRIVASETGETSVHAIRAARSYLAMRRKAS